MMTFTLDPDAVLDYQFNWVDWLDDDETITSHTVVPTAGIDVDSSTEDGGVVTVWVSGASGRYQRVTCRIITNQGRTDDRTIRFQVTDR